MSTQQTANVEVKRPKMSAARKRRIALYSILGILGMAFILPLASYTVHFLGNEAIAQDVAPAANPRSNYWTAVKDGVGGYTSVTGQETGVLIAPGGPSWLHIRDNIVGKYLPWLIVGMFVILVLYHLIHGRNKLDHAPSGRRIKRWNWLDRLVHWTTAISFIALAITGVSMLIGKVLLIPLLGKAGFSLWAQASITIHNVLGPVFTVGIVMMIVMWIWHNFPNATDLQWFKEGGGLFSKTHPSAGRMNGGEKVWFWLVATVGLAVCITGVIMVAPVYGIAIPAWAEFVPLASGTRPEMQQANLIHAILSLGWTAIALGHIYIGTAGTEGAFEGMSTGYVSAEWAKQHHDQWYDKAEARGKILEPVEEVVSAKAAAARAATSSS